MASSIAEARESLGIEELRDFQKDVIQAYQAGKDVFLCAPTGSGKTVAVEMAPLVLTAPDARRSSSVVVVSPLIQLMRNQRDEMVKKGISAVCLSDMDISEQRKVEEGHVQVVLGSPEAWLGRWRTLLHSDVFRDSVSALFIDEAHCINSWGVDKKKDKAFRETYGRLGEMRAMLQVPCIAMTATASNECKVIIKTMLDMSDSVDVFVNPNKCNIRYSVFDQVSRNDLWKSFDWLVQSLELKGRETEKTIIFTKSYKDCYMLYEYFLDCLGEKSYCPFNFDGINDDRNRLFDMFHSNVDDEQKNSTVKSFNDPTGNIRVLIATSALGMGVDIKDVYECYHFGPPHDFDSYLQETGRVGRCTDKISHAVLITFKKCILGKVSKEMKMYVKNDQFCRRKILYSSYVSDSSLYSNEVLHTCCDVCAMKCECENCGECLSTLHKNVCTSDIMKKKQDCIPFSNEARMYFKERLLEFRMCLFEKCGEKSFFTGCDAATGFSFSLVNTLVDNVTSIVSLDVLMDFPFFDTSHVKDVWNILLEVKEKYSITENCDDDSDDDSDDDDSYGDDVDDDDDSDDSYGDDVDDDELFWRRRKRAVVLRYSDSESD